MQEKTRRLRRCQLSVPGSSEKMMAKAAGMGVDFVFLDLEDAVAPSEKRPARRQTAARPERAPSKPLTQPFCMGITATTGDRVRFRRA